MKKVTYIETKYYELEDLVKEKYPFIKEYEFVCVEECGNDVSKKFNIDGKLTQYDIDDWEKIEKNGYVHNYRNRVVLQKLCADGHIEAGKYLVNVSW